MLVRTFMLCSRENSSRLGGCNNKTPCRLSRALNIRVFMLPSSLLASSRSRVWIRRVAMFHWNPSCNLKNSRKAASSLKSERNLDCCFLGICCCCCASSEDCLGLVAGVVLGDLLAAAAWADRQIWARRPSTCRKPFLTLGPSKEERLSNATESRVSIFRCGGR